MLCVKSMIVSLVRKKNGISYHFTCCFVHKSAMTPINSYLLECFHLINFLQFIFWELDYAMREIYDRVVGAEKKRNRDHHLFYLLHSTTQFIQM